MNPEITTDALNTALYSAFNQSKPQFTRKEKKHYKDAVAIVKLISMNPVFLVTLVQHQRGVFLNNYFALICAFDNKLASNYRFKEPANPNRLFSWDMLSFVGTKDSKDHSEIESTIASMDGAQARNFFSSVVDAACLCKELLNNKVSSGAHAPGVNFGF